MRPVVAGGTGVSTVGAAQTAFKIPPFDGTATISGAWTYTANQKFNDSVKALFGTGSDLEIYHNGTNSIIADVGTGALLISGSIVQLRGNAGDILLSGSGAGAIDLRYNNNVKAITTNTGFTVTGLVSGDTIGGSMVSTDISADTGSTTKVPHVAAVEALVNGFTSTEQTITSAALLTLPHGLGAAPTRVSLQLSCQTGEHNWVAGDKPFVTGAQSSGATARHNSVWADATNVYVRFSDIATCFAIGNKTTGVAVNLTNANWKLIVKAGL